MKLFELLDFNRDMLRNMHTAGIKPDDYKYPDLFDRYKGRPDVLFVVDPPYLSTDTATYQSDKYWKLRDYLDVLKVLPGQNYVFFTSDKSSLVELCRWMTDNPLAGNPFSQATIKSHHSNTTYNGHYTDMMLYRAAL